MSQTSITIPATLQAVSQFSAELENLLDSLANEIRVIVVLGVQELCVNIVNHAYEGTPGTISIQFEYSYERLCMIFLDHAPKHFSLPEVFEPPDPLDLQEHGMGLYLIHQAFDQVDYEPQPVGNRWRLVKQLL